MSWTHYRALMYKNWILWKRRLFGSICEVLFPIFMFAALALIRSAVTAEDVSESSFLTNAVYVRSDPNTEVTYPYPEGNSFSYCSDYLKEGGEWTIGLSPQTEITEYLADKFLAHLNLAGVTITYFDDNDEIDDYVKDSKYEDSPKLCVAVVFEKFDDNDYEYSIRFNQTDSIPGENQPVGEFIDVFYMENYEPTDEFIREPKPEFQDQFIESGFSLIQNWVDNYIIRQITGDENAYIAAMFVPMYFDDWVDDDFLPLIKDTFGLLIVIAYLVPISRMIASIVQEKEYKVKEMMMMMGLSNTSYWLSWITYYSIIYIILSIVATILIGVSIFTHSNLIFFFLLFLLFGISCMCFSLLISVFFSRSKSALTLGMMVFIATFFVIFAVDDPNLETSKKKLGSLVPSVAFTLGIVVMIEFEIGQTGLTTDTFNQEIVNFKYSTALTFLIIDILYFLALALYFEQVWPTDWGTKRPWYFLFTRNFWFGDDESSEDFTKEVEWGPNVQPINSIQEEQKKSGKCILIRNLTKSFNGQQAVKGLNLDIFEGQILALLGHNGAGKTTTISMLTGLIPMTSGDVKIGNLLLSKDMNKIRKNLGVCPQHNVLFHELTPEEHLYLYSIFKGMTDKALIQEKIEEKLREVKLIPQRDRRSENLSGGQKRKLSLALALIGDSKIVLLDEPTSGMDLTARRLMWDMLKDNKGERIIILTTHYMQEADILADRIAILSHGKLRCLGDSLFLKNKFGVGYYLTLVKEQNADSPQHTQMIENFVKGFIPEAKLARKIAAEMSFQIPMASAQVFHEFFEALDAQKEELSIKTYAISVTTLEEVFIRVARGDDDLVRDAQVEQHEREREEHEREDQKLIETERETKGLFFRHMVGLIVKRFRITMRDFKAMVFELIVPLLLVLAGISFMLIADRFLDADPYSLVISKYETPQDILYPREPGTIEEIMDLLEVDTDITTNSIVVTNIEAFDIELFEQRDFDPYRMGSLYFYLMSEENNQYEPVIFHNQTAFQSMPTYYQSISQAILQSIDPNIKVKVKNHPLPITDKVEETENTASGVFAALIFGLGFSFIPGAIIAYIVRERQDSVKHQHMISGVSLWAYWLSNFLWDIIKYSPVLILSAVFLKIFDVDAFVGTSEAYLTIWLLLLLFGFSMIMFSYSSSFFFQEYSSAQVVTIVFHFITGSVLPMLNYILFVFDATRPFAKVFRWICRLFPNYCLGNGFLYVGSLQAMATLDGEENPYDPLDLASAGGDVLMMVVDTILYTLILILLEWIECSPFIRKLLSKPTEFAIGDYKPDADVEIEEKAAMEIDPSEVKVNVRKLRKVYGGMFTSSNVAVECVSFNVPKCQCFALLGVNGAGKTTTFRMLTGEYAPTSGEAYLDGFNVISNLEEARENIGYCPQFDALSELLTCEEHIRLYCEIKGINGDKISELVTDLLDDLDLTEYRTYLAGTLSGGNKRKLSVAIALIGNPTVVFLDEPSAGMDPETRKKLWKVLGNIKNRDSAVVLTTHSMEEAEVLCDRMAIMVGGRLRCIGSSTYLRDKFGQGYELEIKMNMPGAEEVQDLSSKMQTVLGSSSDITKENVKECLEVINAEYLYSQITAKGSGTAIYHQLKSENKIPRDAFCSWVLSETSGRDLLAWLRTEFEDASIIEHYLGLYRFKVSKQADKSLGYLFSLIESNREAKNISEYAVSPTTMDQIFSAFAAEGNEVVA